MRTLNEELRRMRELSNIILEGPQELAAIDFLSATIKRSKFKGKIFIAGGYVRDELLGLDPKDIDLVVELPNGGIEFANWITKKLKIYKKGSNPVVFPNFGTAKFNLKGITHNGQDLSSLDIEVVMTRKEKYNSKNRKPEVSPGSLKDDVDRRDFTVNSLLKNLSTGEILDLTGMGKSDLQRGVVRTPLDPDIIFDDDPLRMLRAIRFTMKYNWKLPMFMIRSMKKNATKLRKISAERIRDELSKMLITGNPDKAIRLLQITGLNKFVMPELDNLVGLEQGHHHDADAMKHTLKVVKGVPNKLVTRLSALLHDIGKSQTRTVVDNEVHFYTHEKVSAEMAREILTRLKYPKEIINAVVVGVQHHMKLKGYGDEASISDKALRKLQRELGDHLNDTLDLIHADNVAHSKLSIMPNQIPNLKKKLQQLSAINDNPKLPINGNEIMKHVGLKPGKLVGKLLALVQDAMDENPRLTKDEALALIKLAYNQLNKK
jgi:poly(A) polymerase